VREEAREARDLPGEIVDPQVADRLDQVERLSCPCLEHGPRHAREIPCCKVVDSVKERDETRAIGPVAGIVAVRQGRDAPRREQHADGRARRDRDEPVDHPVLILRKESLKRVSNPEPPGDTGRESSSGHRVEPPAMRLVTSSAFNPCDPRSDKRTRSVTTARHIMLQEHRQIDRELHEPA
jgi:hypothetical protein